MSVFRPPVVYDNPPFPLAPGEDPHYMLDKYRLPMARGVNVYQLSDGSYVQDVATAENKNTAIPPYPLMPDQGPTPNLISRGLISNTKPEVDTTITPYVVYIFYGGHANPVTAAQAAALTAYTTHGVGYGALITPT